MCLQMKGSQVTTTSSLSLWAVSFNIYSHRGFLNPDSWITFIPLSLCRWPAKTQGSPRAVRHSNKWGWTDTPEIWLHCLPPETMTCYFTCTLPPFSESHESIHVGVIYSMSSVSLYASAIWTVCAGLLWWQSSNHSMRQWRLMQLTATCHQRNESFQPQTNNRGTSMSENTAVLVEPQKNIFLLGSRISEGIKTANINA